MESESKKRRTSSRLKHVDRADDLADPAADTTLSGTVYDAEPSTSNVAKRGKSSNSKAIESESKKRRTSSRLKHVDRADDLADPAADTTLSGTVYDAEPSTSNVAKRGKSSNSKAIESESKKRRTSSRLKHVDRADDLADPAADTTLSGTVYDAEPSTSNVAKRGKSSNSKAIESESKKRRTSSRLKHVDRADDLADPAADTTLSGAVYDAETSTSNVAEQGESSNSKAIESESKKKRSSSPFKYVDRAAYKNLCVFKKPCPLVEIDREGKLKPCVEVLSQLKQIECPLNVIAITGPYRTGKSYLLNYLAGERKGFPLGSTVYSETKGIWVWCQPHPKKHEVLLLLDTEGLGDVMEGDEENVTWIFALSVLLSSTLVYNCKSNISQDGLSQLHYVTQMTKRIKKREASEDEDGSEFFTFFPNFVWVVRDFTLGLKDKAGNPITSNQYLMNALQLREGNKPNIVASNTSRQCIREYFADKKCFVLPQPVKDGSRLDELESVPDAQLDGTFLQEAKRFCDYIYTQSFHKTAAGQPVQGKMFCHLLEIYLQSIQSGNIPCVENAVNKMAEKKNADAVEASFKVYEKEMNKILQKSIDTEEELFKAHHDCYSNAMETFMSMSILDEIWKYQYQLKENIEQKFNEIVNEWVQEHKESHCANGDHDMNKERTKSELGELETDFSTLQLKLIRETENTTKEAERREIQRRNELDEIRDNRQENMDEILNTLSEQANHLNRDRENAETNLTDIREGGASFGRFLQRTNRICEKIITTGWETYKLGLLLWPKAALGFAAIGAILGGFREFMSTQNICN